MIFTVRHELNEEVFARLENRADRLDEVINEAAEKIQRVWILSLIGTGVVAFGLGFTVAKLTREGD